MKPISAFYNVMSSANPKWIDSETFAFIGNASGAFQVWQGYTDGRAPVQLSFDENRVWTLGGADVNKNVYFGMDTGGDEQEQIYKVDWNTKIVTNLTNNPKARHYIGPSSPDGKWLYFAGNARNPANFDLCRMNLETYEQEIILQNEDNYNNPGSLSPNGRYLTFNKMKGLTVNYMWILDLETGKAEKVVEEMEFATAKNACWNKDSTGFWFLTNYQSEWMQIAYYDLATKKMEYCHTKEGWDIDQIALSKDGRYMAEAINEGGYLNLKVWDMVEKVEVNHPRIPKSTGGNVSWNGHKLIMNLTSGKRTNDIWVLDLDADSLKRVTTSPMGGITADDLVEPELHKFNSYDGLEVPFWVFRKEKKVNKVVIEIHGGPEGQEKPIYKPLTAYLVSRGFTVVAPNVRGSVGYGKTYTHLDDIEKRMDSVKDIGALVDYIIEAGIAEKGNIAVMGGSYGGFMTLASITEFPDAFTCAVDTVGICNFETFLENTSSYRRANREVEYGSLAEHRHILRAVSPIHKIDKVKCPLMVIHGARDPRVPISEAEQVVEKVSAKGIPVKYLRYEDEGHGLAKLKNKLDCYPQVADFLNEHMK